MSVNRQSMDKINRLYIYPLIDNFHPYGAVVCRSCDKRLWSHIDVSRCSPLSNQALAGIIKRHPTSLDLSWTPLAMKQLNCLLTRLPGTNRHKHTPPCPYTPHHPQTPVFLCRFEGTQADWSALVVSVCSGLSHSAPVAAAGSALV